ncbi:HlyD family type I secretion periplasmic adaptor subunit [Tardiphaga sp. OK245]|uniref:HlyD family type I secretion periplasmic adaptor subunit n=1 Tax=Tardiphaga sp. OK245 TaxID=1855306 RepID=UPI0008A743D6|nr:HlyD family type I secretion periplasmic adaptor subunit [Tardiphaga sp. OK245]SEI04202.1 HlyD family secretion protein [Tardiphaga sp. OK245]
MTQGNVKRSDWTPADRSVRAHGIWGGAVLLLLVVGVGGWAAFTELSGAVVTSGVVVVESEVKKVQHPTGGVIGEIRVKDGDRVREGDVVIRLDETVTRANLAIVIKSLNEMVVRQARLEAERDGAESVVFPPELVAQQDQYELAGVIAGERRLFELRKSARAGQTAQLRERILQLQEEISGLSGQSASKRREIEFVNRELVGLRDLWDKKLVPINRVMMLEREAVRLDGDSNQYVASAAQAKGKKAETELQIIQIDQDLRSEVAKELREIQGKSAELVERKVAAEDQLKRIDLRSPQNGNVHQLTVHTVGGVIGPSEPLMLIVPENDALTVEIRIAPQDIDQIRLGQPVNLRFSAFNQRTTPEIVGLLSRISADISQDQKTGVSYYLGRVSLSSAELSKLAGLKLLPGMPVEAFVRTEDRTVLSYLVKPLHDQIAKAFRER